MRLIERRDAPLVIGLIAGTAVMFGQPLRFVLSVAEDVSRLYHVDLIPGFVIFVIVCTIHYWRKHRDAITAIQLTAREFEEAKKTAVELEQLMLASQAIANAVDSQALRVEAWRQIPPLLKSRQCWCAIVTPEGWRWLIEPGERADALLDVAPSFLQLAESGERRHNEWLIVPLHSSGRALGILVVEETTPLTPMEKSRTETLATVLATALKNAQLFAEMQASSASDALTGCFNRAHAFRTLEHELRRSRRTKSPLAVLMLDVDGFKKVNDQHGHLVGDRVLESIGDALRRTLRTTDIKCRYGGDEFLVILPDTPPDAVGHVAEHLRRAIEQLELTLAHGSMTCRISIGAAGAAPGEVDAAALVQRADEALYRDKLRGLRLTDAIDPDMRALPVGATVETV